jgi:pimeloyl-ACP methyl ester carboxylesterase
LRAAEVLEARLPRAERRTIAGAGHIVNLDAPEQFLAEVISFLNRLFVGPESERSERISPSGTA